MTATPDPNYGSGEAGFSFAPLSGGQPVGDGSFWDAFTVYYGSVTDQNIPNAADSSGNTSNAVFAVALGGPFNNCLTVDVVYSKGMFPSSSGAISSTTVDVRLAVFDACANSGAGGYEAAMAINPSFLQNYVYTYSNGDMHPQAITQVSRFPNGSWHALLYNVQTQGYDDIYQSAASASTNGGTAQVGFAFSFMFINSNIACPQVDALGESGLRAYTGTGPDSGFAEIDSLSAGGAQFNDGAGPCFPTTPLFAPPYYRALKDDTGLTQTVAGDSSYLVEMGS